MPWIAAWCAVRLYRAYYGTLRVRCLLPSGAIIRARDHPMRGQIFALCECDTLALFGLMLKHRLVALVAHGRDGDWASSLLSAAGCRVVRGSTRRGGTRALLRMVRTLGASDDPAGIVVDGPLGPAGVAKPGVVLCGLKSGRPVRALGVASRWKLTLSRTWSGLYVPLPFSTVMVTYDTADIGTEESGDVSALTERLTEHLTLTRKRAQTALRSRSSSSVASAIGGAGRALTLMRDGVLTLVALPFLLPIWLLPWTAAAHVGRLYGYVAWAAMPEARRVGMINMRRALGLSRQDAGHAVRGVFANLGQSLAEGIQFARRFKHATADVRALCESEDPELERRILADTRPRIFVTGHLGSWELAASLAARQTGRPGAVVVRPIDNPFLDQLWRRFRVGRATEWIDKRGAASDALARLRRGEDVAMLLDEHGGPRGVFVPFFGTSASTRKTPAVLSLATGAPVIVGACIRRPGQPFLFRLALLEPDRSAPADAAIADLTARIVSTYEAWIRETPLQWRWIHWRWKARPDGTEERYGRVELRRVFDQESRSGAGSWS